MKKINYLNSHIHSIKTCGVKAGFQLRSKLFHYDISRRLLVSNSINNVIYVRVIMIKFDGINDVVNNSTHCANSIVSLADSYYEQLLINLLQQISTCVTMMSLCVMSQLPEDTKIIGND